MGKELGNRHGRDELSRRAGYVKRERVEVWRWMGEGQVWARDYESKGSCLEMRLGLGIGTATLKEELCNADDLLAKKQRNGRGGLQKSGVVRVL